ncbi:hypothetical protein OFDDKENP_00157 [Aeromonas phage B614]|nr:hypothetical protein OFDDKENP_00157 [Aeromonas phage B614]UYD58479.1 hypothetical protein IPAKJDPM_00136 [Aeromonas phage avDM14-QBC]UYD58695.1 hypothetical protein HNNIDBEH_00102 [Aeromonas phage avDM10-HWA]UYD59002.1 hypothetical protein OFOPOMKI_00152 [Aeromonas phage avDM7-IJDJ]UYD59814.1 hypothetical protein LEHPIFIF_00041 [Aeromonas phage avDM9-HANS]
MIKLKCIDREGMISHSNLKFSACNLPVTRKELEDAIDVIERQSFRKIEDTYHAVTPMCFAIAKDCNKFFAEVIKKATIDLTSTFSASVTVPSRDMGFVMGKLMEEVGEFAKSINQPDRCDERPVGEAADVINCVCDMLYLQYRKDYPELGDAQIVDLIKTELNLQLNMKSEKWMSKACIN